MHTIFQNLANTLIPGVTIDLTTIIAGVVFLGLILMFVDYVKEIFETAISENNAILKHKLNERLKSRISTINSNTYKPSYRQRRQMDKDLSNLRMERDDDDN